MTAASQPAALALGITGFAFADLFDPTRLGDLTDAFDRWLESSSPELFVALQAYRRDHATIGDVARSEALVKIAPQVSASAAKLFGVEAEVEEMRRDVALREPLWAFRREFVKKRVLKADAGKAFRTALTAQVEEQLEDRASFTRRSVDVDARAVAQAAIAATLGHVTGADEELDVARGGLRLFEIEDTARKVEKGGGAQWTDELRARAATVHAALYADGESRAVVTDSLGERAQSPDLAADARAVAFALEALEAWLAQRRGDLGDVAHKWSSLRAPKTLDYNHLVELRRPEPVDRPELFVGDERRERGGFALTDRRGSARLVEEEIDYCLFCHERDKDSCSKGMHDKPAKPAAKATAAATGTGPTGPTMPPDRPSNRDLSPTAALKKNPLGVALAGCPLNEKISEMHAMRQRGDVLAAMALITLDNPMCPGTGHRICNDCMKGCIFQKQEPVNIPQIETRVLTETLSLPWGLEIYGLLTRWNPLHVERPHARPYNGKNVLVVGLGPAGYTLAHHLACEGFAVAAVDGLKIEPLPERLTGKLADDGSWTAPEPVRDFQQLYEELDERVLLGFGGVSEYGITVRWDKNFLTLIYATLARHRNFRAYGGVRFGGTLSIDDAWELGFDHVAIAAGAGRPTLINVKNDLARGMRQASDFLMALQLTGAFKRSSLANLQVELPAIVIGGGLTAIDTATELLAYYLVQIEKTASRYRTLVEQHGADAPGEARVRALFDDEEWSVLTRQLAHAREVEEEKARAANEGGEAKLGKLLDSWGGVTLCYRKSLADSPAYRLNHEEVTQSLEEGVRYVEHLSPTEAVLDADGHVIGMKFARKDGSVTELPARTVCVAAGTSPNVTYEREHEGTFALDARGYFFQAYTAKLSADGKSVELEKALDVKAGFFTNYVKGKKTVSFYGDNHPHYAGSVVKAMASAKDGHPKVAALFPETRSLDPKDQPARDAARAQLYQRLDGELLATVVAVNRLTPTIVEVVVKAPMAARKFLPGQFYRLQNFEVEAAEVEGTKLAMEGLALTGAWTEPDQGLMGTIVLEMGGSSRLCAALRPGEPVVLMGPTGAPTEIVKEGTVLLCGGGLGNAVLFSIARAFKAMGSKVLYFAGYKVGEDLFKQDDIERWTDQVIWCTDAGAAIEPRRAQDAHFRGNIVQAMVAFGKGELTLKDGAAAAGKTTKLSDATRIIAIGSDRMMGAVREARHAALRPLLDPKHLALGSINSPMQCMMKEVCAQCLQRHRDPETGKESVVFTCYNQDQPLDQVDFGHLRERLRANSMQEKLSNAWLDHLLVMNPHILRV
jgi:NADPH-dependent glutamate synthase beta subunit-like oxidoreductase/NAD(P)H-flavin reductase